MAAAAGLCSSPVNPSQLLFIGADGHIHLLSGVKFTAGTNPCSQTGLTDTDLSAEAFPSTSPYATGQDANPDWSPNGQQIVFNSTRGGGDTLFIIDLTTSPISGYPIWAGLAAPNQTSSTEPVFSPDGTEISFVQPRKGTQVYDQMLVSESGGKWQTDGSATDLSEQMSNGVSFDSEPDWQPIPGTAPVLPESGFVPGLPVAALLVSAAVLALLFRRARRRSALA